MYQVREELEAQLGTRYRVDHQVGRGGMASVWLARDLKHDRDVALKILHPELASAVGVERFLREIHIAAKLTHPHILPVHDSGEAGSLLWYAMPFIEGESLRGRLSRERQLPIDDALRITREIAEALDYAHRHGIVHRDIKPENILLEAGHAVVADFGVARAVTAAGGERLTITGAALGTPSYMSPEQGGGSGELDGRSDQYSLACVLYEMLTGDPPFTGPSPQAVLARHAVDPPPPVRTVRPSVSEAVDRALAVALAKVPADRFPTAAEFAAALSRPVNEPVAREPGRRPRPARLRGPLILVTAAVLLIAVGGWLRRFVPAPSSEHTVIRSLAVLPFINLGPDPANEYLSDGLTEDLINSLARQPDLRVVARTSAFSFKGKAEDVRSIGTKLQVGTILEGSLRRLGDSLHITAQLTSVRDGYELWSASYDRHIKDLSRTELEILHGLATPLHLEGRASRLPRRASAQGEDAEAHVLYLRGRHWYNKFDLADMQKALSYFDQAIARDPTWALAYTGLADTYYELSSRSLPPQVAMPKARAAAKRALELDDSLAEAYVSLGTIQQGYDWDWPAAEQSFRRAIALSPNYATAHHRYGYLLSLLGRLDQASEQLRVASELDPLSPSIEITATWPLWFGRRFDQTIAALQSIFLTDTSLVGVLAFIAEVRVSQGDFARGIPDLERYLSREYSAYYYAILGRAKAGAGRWKEVQAILDSLTRRTDPPNQYALAVLYAGLGQTDKAVDWLEKGYQARDEGLTFIKEEPLLDPLRSNPRFQALLTRMRLE